MNIEHNKTIAVQLVTAAGDSRIEDLLSWVTDDATWWISGTTEFSGTYPVRKLFEESAKLFRGTEGPFTSTIGAVTAEGNRVAIEAEAHVRFIDGRVYHNLVHLLLTFRDGKVASVKEYGDTEHLVKLFSGRSTLTNT